MQGECPAYRQNYADLDPTYRDAYGNPLLRVTFNFTDNERKMVQVRGREGDGADHRPDEPGHSAGQDTITDFNIVPYQSTHIMRRHDDGRRSRHVGGEQGLPGVGRAESVCDRRQQLSAERGYNPPAPSARSPTTPPTRW